MEIHHTKHHQAYINNVNAAIAGTDWENKSIEDLVRCISDMPENKKTGHTKNNGGGHANHSLFWTIMSPSGGGTPTGKIGSAIEAELGGFEKFKEDFSNAAKTRFGSGWAWLSVDNGKLKVESTPNQDSPLMQGRSPILGLDVWEHACYFNYQNKRPDYVEAFFNVINWSEVEQRYTAALA